VQAQLSGSGRSKEAAELQAEITALELAVTALSDLQPGNILEEAAILVAEQALKKEETKLQDKLNALAATTF
jgi:hypothetical protein